MSAPNCSKCLDKNPKFCQSCQGICWTCMADKALGSCRSCRQSQRDGNVAHVSMAYCEACGAGGGTFDDAHHSNGCPGRCADCNTPIELDAGQCASCKAVAS